MNQIELLAPAGDEECLRSALDYGCDAVYLAGKSFGMRAGAKNFDMDGLDRAVRLAHERGVKVHLTCNTIPLNSEIEQFPKYIAAAQECGVDAAIACDLGVISMIKEYAPKMELHISTQTGVVNYQTAIELYKMGAKRVVLAREVGLEDIREIHRRIPADMEIETFVHGAMCVSFSGRCLISEYLTGRGANRGMCMIDHLDDLIDAGVTSFKIEGRAKSAYYVALTVNAYRAALDSCLKGEKPPKWVLDEVNKISHRPYSTGFFYGKPTDGSGTQDPNIVTNGGQYFADSGYMRDYDFVGVVDYCEDGVMHLTQRNYFTLSDELELLPPHAEPIIFKPESMFGADGTQIDIARRATEKLSIPTAIVVPPHTILRKKMN